MLDFEQHLPGAINMLRELVEIESPSNEKEGVDRVGNLIQQYAQSLNGIIEVHPQEQAGNHVSVRWEGGSKSGVLLLCHMDTVHPYGSLSKNPFREQDGKLYGPGVLDMKASIVLVLWVLERMKSEGIWPDRPITALFTSDEEVGSKTSRGLIENTALQAGLVLCMEPATASGGLKTWRKGVGDYKIEVVGRAAHAGVDPENGRSAVLELAHQIIAVQSLADTEKGTTINVGLIQGGTAGNVVPETAWAKVDVRVLDQGEAKRIDRGLHALRPALDGTKVIVRGELNRPPMPRDEMMVQTYSRAVQIAARYGWTVDEGGTGGGSDANFVAPLRIPVLDGLGPVGEGAHSEREFIWLNSLPQRAALLATLLADW
jgi:glutamate carboxypeptidase